MKINKNKDKVYDLCLGEYKYTSGLVPIHIRYACNFTALLRKTFGDENFLLINN